MSNTKINRRNFIKQGLTGFGIVLSGQILLNTEAVPTEKSGDLDEFLALSTDKLPKLKPTEDNILGPFHVNGAPFRGKVSHPAAKGEILLIKGRVFGFDTKRPLVNTSIDGRPIVKEIMIMGRIPLKLTIIGQDLLPTKMVIMSMKQFIPGLTNLGKTSGGLPIFTTL